MVNAPRAVDKLPLLEHNGVEIQPILHYGFSSPKKGPQPAARPLYGAKDGNGERHWRSSLDAIKQLIEKDFASENQEQ